MSSILSFFRAIGLIWRNRDRLAPLLQALPGAAHAAGHGMDLAGQGAVGAGRLMRGGAQGPLNARSSVLAAGEAISDARQRVNDTAAKVRAAATTLAAITVPVPNLRVVSSDGPEVVTGVSVSPTFGANIGPIAVMTGISVTPTTTELPGVPSVSLDTDDVAVFTPVAQALEQGADRLDNLAAALGASAGHLDALAKAFDSVGEDLDTVVENLRTGGKALEEVTEPWAH